MEHLHVIVSNQTSFQSRADIRECVFSYARITLTLTP